MARDVIDLPEPDSPTRPRTSPGTMEKLRLRTAERVCVETTAGRPAAGADPRWAGNSIFKFRTSSRGRTISMVAARAKKRRPAGDGQPRAAVPTELFYSHISYCPRIRGRPFLLLPITTTLEFGLLARFSVASMPFHSSRDGVMP